MSKPTQLTPDDVIFYVLAKGYTLASVSCGYLVLNKNRKSVLKIKRGAPTREAEFLKIYKEFNTYLDSH